MKKGLKDFKEGLHFFDQYYIIEDDKYVFLNKPTNKEDLKLLLSLKWEGKTIIYYNNEDVQMKAYVENIRRERDIKSAYASSVRKFFEEVFLYSFLAALLFSMYV